MALNEAIKKLINAVVSPPKEQHNVRNVVGAVLSPPKEQHNVRNVVGAVLSPPKEQHNVRNVVNVVIRSTSGQHRARKTDGYVALEPPKGATYTLSGYTALQRGTVFAAQKYNSYSAIKQIVRVQGYKNTTYTALRKQQRKRAQKKTGYTALERTKQDRVMKSTGYAVFADPNAYNAKDVVHSVIFYGPYSTSTQSTTNAVIYKGPFIQDLRAVVNTVIYDPVPKVTVQMRKVTNYVALKPLPPPPPPITTYKTLGYAAIEQTFGAKGFKTGSYNVFIQPPAFTAIKKIGYAALEIIPIKLHNTKTYTAFVYDGDNKTRKIAGYIALYEHPPVRTYASKAYSVLTPPAWIRARKKIVYSAMAFDSYKDHKAAVYTAIRPESVRAQRFVAYNVMDNVVWNKNKKTAGYAALEYAEAPMKTRKKTSYAALEKSLDNSRARKYGAYIVYPPSRLIAKETKGTTYTAIAPVVVGNVLRTPKTTTYMVLDAHYNIITKVASYTALIQLLPLYVKNYKGLTYAVQGPPNEQANTTRDKIRTSTS